MLPPMTPPRILPGRVPGRLMSKERATHDAADVFRPVWRGDEGLDGGDEHVEVHVVVRGDGDDGCVFAMVPLRKVLISSCDSRRAHA